MSAPELITYVRQQSQAGVSAREVRETLMNIGWSELDVDNAFHDVAAGLHPVTAGASIHEDLAQVRGLVAHLMTRVGRLEARLTGQGAALSAGPEALEQPGTASPSRELPAPQERHLLGISLGVLFDILLCGVVGWYVAQATTETAPAVFRAVGGGVLVLAVLSWISLRLRHPILTRLSSAAVIAIGAWTTWLAWSSHQLLEGTTGIAIGVLLLVYGVVVSLWVGRMTSRA